MRSNKVKRMQVWENGTDSFITFQRNEDGDISYITEHEMLEGIIWRELDKCDNVSVLETKVNGYDWREEDGGVDILLPEAKKLRCKLLVGSDGAKSMVRRLINPPEWSKDYGQMGIVANLHVAEAGLNNVAWQRFTEDGPIALLPVN